MYARPAAGGGSWIRGMVEVSKRYLMQVAAHNLGVILRTGTTGITASTNHAAVSSLRAVPHDGQEPRNQEIKAGRGRA